MASCGATAKMLVLSLRVAKEARGMLPVRHRRMNLIRLIAVRPRPVVKGLGERLGVAWWKMMTVTIMTMMSVGSVRSLRSGRCHPPVDTRSAAHGEEM